MKDYGFKIKVSDLLRNPGQKDELSFENKFSKNIPNMTQEGMKGEVFLQSLDENTVFVEIKNLETTINESCEICGTNFERKIELENISTKFVYTDKLLNPDEKIHDEEFEINPKDETIDLEEFLVQLIISESPVVMRCDICEENSDNEETDDETNLPEPTNTENKIQWL